MAVFFIFIPYFAFDNSNNDKTSEILLKIWPFFFGGCAVALILYAIKSYEVAIFDDEGLTIRCPFYVIKKIKWTEIVNVSVEKLLSGNAGVSKVYFYWIVIRTEFAQNKITGGTNSKKSGPWYIRCSTRNAKVLLEYLRQYNPDCINFDENVPNVKMLRK